jgi:hypothetical protein
MIEATPSDWINTAMLAVTITALYFANRKRIKLEAFILHAASHPIPGSSSVINTHSVLVRNGGNATATNVRLVHDFMPDGLTVTVFPPVNFERKQFKPEPTSEVRYGGEILIEVLRPQEQYVFAYMYPAGISATAIGLSLKHDDGIGFRYDTPNITPMLPGYQLKLILLFMIVGFLVCTYFLLKLIVLAIFSQL